MQPGQFVLDAGSAITGSSRLLVLSSTCEMALLTRAPDPEGAGWEEISGVPGYARQLVSFGPVDQRGGCGALRNQGAVVFGPVSGEWPDVLHAAVLGADGRAIYYGRLRRAGSNSDPFVRFGPSAIQLHSQRRLG